MRDMIKSTLTLFVICFGVTLCLALVNQLTKDVIAERIDQEAEKQRTEVLENAQRFEPIKEGKEASKDELVREVYAGYDGQTLVGYVFSAFPKGYGGEMKVTVGISTDGKVTGVRIGENNETPGLGTKASEEGFIGQYVDKAIDKALAVVKRKPTQDNEVEAISGATITSNAVTEAVQASAELAGKLIKDGGKIE